jgi:DNA-binding transcriptional regulator YdaS (Cro superfamily)
MLGMNLHEYLNSEGALTVAQLRERIGVKSDAQIKQWQYGWADRQPGPQYCVAIEDATKGRVRRWDLRPDDWHLIWPELKRKKDAPKIAAKAG